MPLIPDVVSGQPIQATWGNAIRNQTVQVCTSTTRPPALTDGMMWYETDTQRLYQRQGGQNVPLNAPASFSTQRASVWAVATATQAAMYWGSPIFDPLSMLGADPNHHIATIPAGAGGLWMFGANITWQASATGIRSMWFAINDSPTDRWGQVQHVPSAAEAVLQTTHVCRLVAGNNVRVKLYQTSGGSLNVLDKNNANNFWGVRLGGI